MKYSSTVKYHELGLELQFGSIDQCLRFKISKPNTMTHSVPRLNDQTLFTDQNYVDGQWIDSVSGKRFQVYGI